MSAKYLQATMCLINLIIPLFPLGGEDFDQRVMDHFIKLYKKKKGKDLRKSNRAIQKLRREVEKAKRTLSTQHQARIEIESLYDGEDFSETLTRAKFEELNMVSWTSCLIISSLMLFSWNTMRIWSTPCLPMPWLPTSPGHQQARYWQHQAITWNKVSYIP